MSSPKVVIAPVLQFPTAAASLRAFAAGGYRRILVTSAIRSEGRSAVGAEMLPGGLERGDSSWPSEYASGVASALAGTGPESVLVVQADPMPSDRPRVLGLPACRGLWELLHETYLCDLDGPSTASFGLGDWLEILAAQCRSGTLTVREGLEVLRLTFLKGSIRAIACTASEQELGLTGSALRGQAGERIVRMIEWSRPIFRFTGHPAPAPALGVPPVSCLDGLFRGRLHARCRQPFIAGQIESRLTDTSLPNLKLLPAGEWGVLTPDLHRPLELLLGRLGRAFGIVLLDAPPVARAGLSGLFARAADAVLLVVNTAEVDYASVLRAADELRRAGASMIGVLVDRVGTPAAPAVTG
jgi:hypothetical protein